MGKKNRKRFDKKNALKFTLLHRSQEDPLYYDDEDGSKMVLHPMDAKTSKVMEGVQQEMLDHDGKVIGFVDDHLDSDHSSKNRKSSTENGGTHSTLANALTKQNVTYVPVRREVGEDSQQKTAHHQADDDASFYIREAREIDEFGLPLDGYDYSQHFAQIGSGNFISSSGRVYGALGEDKKEYEDDKNGKTMLTNDETEGLYSGTLADSGQKNLETTLAEGGKKEDVVSSYKNKAAATAGIIPASMLPSKVMFDRMLTAITTDLDDMDPEIRQLLEDDWEEEKVQKRKPKQKKRNEKDKKIVNDIDGHEINNDNQTDQGNDEIENVNDTMKEEEASSYISPDYEGDLDDDFMQQLLKAEEEAPSDDDAFDFNEHIKRLMEEAGDEWEDDEFSISDDEDGEPFDGNHRNQEELDKSEEGFDMNDLNKQVAVAVAEKRLKGILKHRSRRRAEKSSKWEEEIRNIRGTADVRPKREIDEHFDFIMRQYEDDELGELEEAEFDERVGGELDLESEQVLDVMSTYLEDLNFDQQEKHRGILGLQDFKPTMLSSSINHNEKVSQMGKKNSSLDKIETSDMNEENSLISDNDFENEHNPMKRTVKNIQKYKSNIKEDEFELEQGDFSEVTSNSDVVKKKNQIMLEPGMQILTEKDRRMMRLRKLEQDSKFETPLTKDDILPHLQRLEEDELNGNDPHADQLKKLEDENLDDEERKTIILSMWPGGRPQEKPKWDAETIISTYSRTDNHPSRIKVTGMKKSKSRRNRNESGSFANSINEPNMISQTENIDEDRNGELNDHNHHHGDDDDDDDDDNESDIGFSTTFTCETVARDRQETKEEKRERKKAVKALKAARRAEKKGTRLEFKEEKKRIARQAIEKPGGISQGISTFHVN